MNRKCNILVNFLIAEQHGSKHSTSQQTFTCSKAAIETLEKGVKHVQNYITDIGMALLLLTLNTFSHFF